MKVTLFSATVLSLCLTGLQAFAAAPAPQQPTTPAQPNEPDLSVLCPNLTLTAAQADQFKQLGADTHAALKQEKARIKALKADYRAALASSTVDQAMVMQKETALKTEINSAVNILFSASDKLAFTILTPDQRAEGVACVEAIRKDQHKKWQEKKCSKTPSTPADETSDLDDMSND